MKHPTPRAFATVFALAAVCAGPAGASGRGADGDFDRRRSSHFLLLQDVAIDNYSGATGSRRFERAVLAVLEDAHDQLRKVLDVSPRQPVRVVIYDTDVFERDYGHLFRFSAAGFYDGAIHVRAGTQVTGPLVRTLHHELGHYLGLDEDELEAIDLG